MTLGAGEPKAAGRHVEVLSAKLVEQLQARCAQRGWSLGLAESCTGGLVSSLICARPGVSSFYKGSIVSYARAAKVDILNVPESLLSAHGEVSPATATAMAQGACRVLHCDWAVGITGVAGPSGGSPEKPVGFVCFAVVGPGFEKAISKQFNADVSSVDGRQDIQRQAALFAFDFVINAMR